MISTLCLTLISSFAPTQDLGQELRKDLGNWTGKKTPGGIVCVMRGEEVTLLESFGMANIERGISVGPKTPFYIASVAKPMTALCALQAAQAGDLDLDAPLMKLFPELPEGLAQATLRQAMHHTSGILDVYDTAIAANMSVESLGSNELAIELLTRLPHTNFAPGTQFLYSNSGYVLLAEAIRRSTGKSLSAFAREHIFEPFGMEHAYLHGDRAAAGAAIGYRRDGIEWRPRELQTGLVGPGGIFACMEDMQAFAKGVFYGEDVSLREQQVQAPEVTLTPRFGLYGAGWMIRSLGGLRVQRHHGGAFGFGADLLHFPDQQTTVIVLLNAPNLSPTNLAEGIARRVLVEEMKDAQVPPGPVTALSRKEIRAFGRVWRSPKTGEVWIMTPKAPGFVIASLGDVKLKLSAASKTRLVAVETEADFSAELKGDRLVLQHANGRQTELERLPFPATDLPPAADYEGEYGSDALACSVSFEALSDGRLRFVQDSPILEIPPFMALAPDIFFCDSGARVDFHRDADGHVTGLTMHGNRSRNLEFNRFE